MLPPPNSSSVPWRQGKEGPASALGEMAHEAAAR